MIRPAAFQQKRREIEAMQVDADNPKDVCGWVHGHLVREHRDEQVTYNLDGSINLDTPEGKAVVAIGDWVVRDAAGAFHRCTDEDFTAQYELILDTGDSWCAGCGTFIAAGHEGGINLDDGLPDGWLCTSCIACQPDEIA